MEVPVVGEPKEANEITGTGDLEARLVVDRVVGRPS